MSESSPSKQGRNSAEYKVAHHLLPIRLGSLRQQVRHREASMADLAVRTLINLVTTTRISLVPVAHTIPIPDHKLRKPSLSPAPRKRRKNQSPKWTIQMMILAAAWTRMPTAMTHRSKERRRRERRNLRKWRRRKRRRGSKRRIKMSRSHKLVLSLHLQLLVAASAWPRKPRVRSRLLSNQQLNHKPSQLKLKLKPIKETICSTFSEAQLAGNRRCSNSNNRTLDLAS